MISKFNFSFFIFICLLNLSAWTQNIADTYVDNNNIRYQDFEYRPEIRSVQITKDGLNFVAPIIRLNERISFNLSFDDLSAEFKTYTYTFIHCNANWEPSELYESEYMEGFFDNYINDYKFSINTYVSFVHYQLSFPNQNVRLTKSGNYILLVYENNRENPVLTRRFMMVDPQAMVEPALRRSSVIEDRDSKQLLHFTVNTLSLPILNPFEDIKISILQNYRWDNAIYGVKPLFLRNTELIYQYDDNRTAFDGVDEYRLFDTRTIRNLSFNVANIRKDSIWEVDLMIDLPKSFQRYTTKDDLNGQYYVNNVDGFDPTIDADYTWVNFSLKMNNPIVGGDLYAIGAMNNWTPKPEFKMVYDFKNKIYRGRALLKQAVYNFNYAYLENGVTKLDETLIEGSHFETENTYTVLVYFRRMGNRYDELVSFKSLNTMGKL